MDKKNHLLSFVSKVFPSPDWFVGVSGVELCLKNGSWAAEKKIKLYLYDAGTASGVDYKSKPEHTIPPEKISLITAEMSRIHGEDSPFFNSVQSGEGRIKPFAEIMIRRVKVYRRICDEETPKIDRMRSLDADSLDDASTVDTRRKQLVSLVSPANCFSLSAECAVTTWELGPCLGVPFVSGEQAKNRSYVDPGRAEYANCRSVLSSRIPCIPGCNGEDICELSNWNPWSACDNPCGNGFRRRRRTFLHPEGREYCDVSKLTESEECNEWSEYCKHGEVEAELMEDPRCITGEWSEWSPCNATCGLGMKTRSRKYLNYGAEEYCNKPLVQRQRCNMGLSGCDASMTNFQNTAQGW